MKIPYRLKLITPETRIVIMMILLVGLPSLLASFFAATAIRTRRVVTEVRIAERHRQLLLYELKQKLREELFKSETELTGIQAKIIEALKKGEGASVDIRRELSSGTFLGTVILVDARGNLLYPVSEEYLSQKEKDIIDLYNIRIKPEITRYRRGLFEFDSLDKKLKKVILFCRESESQTFALADFQYGRFSQIISDTILKSVTQFEGKPVKVKLLRYAQPLFEEKPKEDFVLLVKDDLAGFPASWGIGSFIDKKGLVSLERAEIQFFGVTALLVFLFLYIVSIWCIELVRGQIRLANLKTDFVTNISHELKTPLTSIRMLAESLKLDYVKDKDRVRRYAAVIDKESERLSRLVDRILDFQGIEKGTKRYKFVSTDLNQLLSSTLDLFRGQMKKEGLRLTLTLDKNLPLLLLDRDALREIIFNLLSNAVKFSGTGKKIDIRTFREKDRIRLSVRDYGIGVADKDKKKIFQEFYRADERLTSEIKGAGLGLAISQHFAKAHGGWIWLESKLGKGTTFTLELPLKKERKRKWKRFW